MLLENMIEYKQGLRDAWDIARMLYLEEGYTADELRRIFGEGYSSIEDIFRNYSITSVIQKITEFTESDFRVGDEVRLKSVNLDRNKYIITAVFENQVAAINKDFESFKFSKKELIKTGYNFELARMMRSIEEE